MIYVGSGARNITGHMTINKIVGDPVSPTYTMSSHSTNFSSGGGYLFSGTFDLNKVVIATTAGSFDDGRILVQYEG